MKEELIRNVTDSAMRRAPRYLGEPLFGIIHPFIIWNIIIIAIVAFIFWWLVKKRDGKTSAMGILDARYAGGEIDQKTYQQIKTDIQDKAV